jgi:hypothetical protein
VHRTRRAGVRASSLVAMAEHVRVAARADVDEGVGLETERGLQALEHVIGTLTERHPRRELRLPGLEYSRRPRLRHASKTERETKLVSFLGGQLASRAERSISAPLPVELAPDNAVPRADQPVLPGTSVNHLNERGSVCRPCLRHSARPCLARSTRVARKSRRSRGRPSG